MSTINNSIATKSPFYLGSPSEEGYPVISKDIINKTRDVFWDIFMTNSGGDCFGDFSKALGCSRHEAKVVYYGIMNRKGFVQDHRTKDHKIKLALAKEVQTLSGEPITVYQIMYRAEDSVSSRPQG